LTSPKGSVLEMPLDLGGFGISRYELDFALMKKAKELGASIVEKTSILSVEEKNNSFVLHTNHHSFFESKVVIGAFGKRSNLDQYLQRDFFNKRSPYIGVKYHLKPKNLHFQHPNEMIALHNFADGYAGFPRIENEKFCFCYLTTRQNLKKTGSIENLEKNILYKNPYIQDILTNSEFIFESPKVINEITFAPKTLFEGNILMCGDTAGMITPLYGNGKAIAIHSAKMLSENLIAYLNQEISYQDCKKIMQISGKKTLKNVCLWAEIFDVFLVILY
jgi:flavin-dependent dehydrogenase